MKPTLSKVFNNGNSQAVRIPAALRLNATEVEIYQNQAGDLVIHPLQPKQTLKGDAIFATLSAMRDWADELEHARQDALPMQDRD